MKILLLLLSACVYTGFCFDTFDEEEYGNRYKMRIQRSVHFIEFVPQYSSDGSILWSRESPDANEDTRRKMMGIFYMIYNVTQRDSGTYILRRRDMKVLSSNTLQVVANTRSYTRTSGEELRFTFDLEPSSCNIYFFPGGNHKTEIVRQGRLVQDSYRSDCAGFDVLKPCGILNEAVHMSCRGHFDVRDHNDDTALVVSLEIESPQSNSAYLLAGGGALLCTCLSCCIKCCYLRKRSSEKERSDPDSTAADEPAVHYHQYDHEPVGPRSRQYTAPSEANDLVQPSQASTAPLINNPSPVILLPAYSEVSAPAEQTDALTVPLNSDHEPRFELKGVNFNSDSLLGSDSPHCDVYMSDKLNFL